MTSRQTTRNTMKLSRPFFVVGFPRSGTTLLQAMLSSCPGLYIPPETKMLSILIRREKAFDPIDTPAGIEQRIETIRTSVCEQHEQPVDWPKLEQELRATTPFDVAHLFDTLLSHIQQQRGCRRIGEKTPLHLLFVERILEWFPDGQVIAILRDGRDASLSSQESLDPERSYVSSAIRWRHYMRLHQRYAATCPADRYTSVRYEDLVTEPERELRRLCDFLGEEFDPAMLEQHRRADKGYAERETHKARTNEPVTDSRIARFRGVVPDAEVAGFQAIAGRELAALGYPLEPVSKLRGWLKVATEAPSILLRRRKIAKQLRSREILPTDSQGISRS